jgi:hypothetical protein
VGNFRLIFIVEREGRVHLTQSRCKVKQTKAEAHISSHHNIVVFDIL